MYTATVARYTHTIHIHADSRNNYTHRCTLHIHYTHTPNAHPQLPSFNSSQVKCYQVSQLALKFERHLDAEIVDFHLLSDDYSKAVFLCCDRTLCFHARFGSYYKVCGG